ncbi:MAG: hypothetical protein JWN14_920 [Chthonomonadales bacterium]|nr:hypothetical protein [Chthonomonadales bacterium]
MTIDRAKLAEIEAQPLPQPQGVQGLLQSIHRAPELREWVTLESSALPPVPVQDAAGWRILTLLVTPAPAVAGIAQFHAPWAAISWSWPEKAVAKRDLRAPASMLAARNTVVFATTPPAGEQVLAAAEQAQRMERLCRSLENLTPADAVSAEELAQLGRHYSALLPAAAYAYYYALAPETQTWLRPDAAPLPRELPVDAVVPLPAASTVQTAPPPENLGPLLGKWLRDAYRLAEVHGLQEIAQEIAALEARRLTADFRLLFIGEFSRGKSTLINRLLGRELLPSGALPTTAVFISLIAGEQERMEVRFGSGEWKTRPLTEESWQDLLAVDPLGIVREVQAEVRLVVQNAWLQKMNMELVDTPGAGDTNLERTRQALELLGRADAAVMVVGADSPFSLSEAAFLENEVLGRRLSRLAITVSKFDLIAVSERARALRVVRARVGKVAPALPVLPLHAVHDGEADEAALEAVRAEIEQLVARGDRGLWRNRQIAEILTDRLGTMVRLGQEAMDAERLTREERADLVQNAEGKLQDADLQWEELRLDLDSRRIHLSEDLRRQMRTWQGDLIESLQFELSRAPDPKAWWERDMPFRLKRELTGLGQRYEQQILSALARDANWLQQETTRAFAVEISRTAPAGKTTAQEELQAPNLALADLHRTRLLSRIGSGAVLVGGYLLGLGPLSTAASLGAGILGERLIGKKLQEQQEMVRRKIPATLERAIDVYSEAVTDRLRQLYSQLLKDSRRSQEAWKSGHMAALHASTPVSEGSWRVMAENASRLQQMIVKALEG